MTATEMTWPAAFALSVFIVCCAAVVIYFLHLAARPHRPAQSAKPVEWRYERTGPVEDKAETEEWEADK